MRLFFFTLLLSTGFAFESVCSYTLKISDGTKESFIRKKRELDEEDVINRFEMERVSPLYDIIRHLPPFEREWIPGPSTVKPPEFKLELSKDEEHVVSQSGRRYRGNSAINWWYSVESFSNITHLNFTDSESEVTNTVQERRTITRKQDEDHVVSHVPSLRTGRGTSLDVVVLESPTTPRVAVTLAPKMEEHKPNITTRYILLQSGRIVAINVTSVSSVFKTNSGSSGNKPAAPVAYFGSRLKKNSSKVDTSNSKNKVLNVSVPIVKYEQKIPTQVAPNRVQNVQTSVEPGRVQNVQNSITSGRLQNVQTSVEPGRVQNLQNSVTSGRVQNVQTSVEPGIVQNVQNSITSGRVQNLQKTVEQGRVQSEHNSVAPDKFQNNNIVTPTRFQNNNIVTPSRFQNHNIVAPNVIRNLPNAGVTTKAPMTSPVLLRSTVPVPPKITTVRESAEKLQKNQQTPTKKPIESHMRSAALLALPKTSTETVIKTSVPTKKTFSSTKPTTPTRAPKSLTITMTATTKVEQFTTKKAMVLHSEKAPSSESTRTNLDVAPSGGTTQIPMTRFHTLPPRNIIETIFDVLQPDTSEIPFLVVTFDSLKTESPIVTTPVENRLRELSTVRDVRARTKTGPMSQVEYEIEGSRKPKLVQYNFNPLQRTSLISTKDTTTTSSLPLTASKSRGFLINLSTPSVTDSPAEDDVRPLPLVKHEFVRIVTLPASAKPVVPSSSSAETSTRHPRYRGLSHITPPLRNRKPDPIPTTTSLTSSSTPSRRPKQQQGFHLRNSVGFQTSPPGAFSDRRSYSGSTIPAEGGSNQGSGPSMDKMVDTLVVRFEPTRRNAKISFGKSPTAMSITETYTTAKYRNPTTRPRVTPISRSVTPTKSQMKPELNVWTRSTVTNPTAAINGIRSGRNSRINIPQAIEEQNSTINSSTTKPFRVYYFEPKRKRVKKTDDTTAPLQEDRFQKSLNSSPSSTISPPKRASVKTPRPSTRAPNSVPRRDQPKSSIVTTPYASLQEVTIPTRPVGQRRSGRARLIPTTASATTSTPVPQTHKPAKKQWQSPFIWHRPNVGTTLVPFEEQKGTETQSGIATTTLLTTASIGKFPLPPDNSFQEVLFQPVEIQRVTSSSAT